MYHKNGIWGGQFHQHNVLVEILCHHSVSQTKPRPTLSEHYANSIYAQSYIVNLTLFAYKISVNLLSQKLRVECWWNRPLEWNPASWLQFTDKISGLLRLLAFTWSSDPIGRNRLDDHEDLVTTYNRRSGQGICQTQVRSQSWGATTAIKQSLFIIWNDFNHRSRETRMNLVFQFAPEKLGHFETKCRNFPVLLFFPIQPRAKYVRFPVVYALTHNHLKAKWRPNEDNIIQLKMKKRRLISCEVKNKRERIEHLIEVARKHLTVKFIINIKINRYLIKLIW